MRTRPLLNILTLTLLVACSGSEPDPKDERELEATRTEVKMLENQVVDLEARLDSESLEAEQVRKQKASAEGEARIRFTEELEARERGVGKTRKRLESKRERLETARSKLADQSRGK